MPRPGVGNPGNKGGGRASAYQEKTAADILKDIFFNPQDKDEVMNKIKSGKYSGFDVLRMKILTGNDRIFAESMRKLVPDLTQIEGGKDPVKIVIDVAREIAIKNNLHNDDPSSIPGSGSA